MEADGHTLNTIAGERTDQRAGSAGDKGALRRAARRRRAETDWVTAGSVIRAQLARWLAARPPTTVLLYLATGEEASVEELAALPELRHRWAAPRLGPDEHLTVHPLGGPVEHHRLGFRQPAADSPRLADREVGVVLVPGVAFDHWGGRLGHGGGHYDRFLARLSRSAPGPARVGVTVDALVLDRRLPMAPHDVPLQFMATESGVQPVLADG
jgi:5-formyltetrahydrofolate cyclo-ligase